jgi:hypothetical protein
VSQQFDERTNQEELLGFEVSFMNPPDPKLGEPVKVNPVEHDDVALDEILTAIEEQEKQD